MMFMKENAWIVLHLTCLFSLTGSSVTFSPINKDGIFECNTMVTLSCHVQPYTSMSMFRNNSRLADCFLASCSTFAALQGYMNFAYDTVNGVFNVTINPITEKDHNIPFRCSDGIDQAFVTPNVKVSNNVTVETRGDLFVNKSMGLTATSGCVYTDSVKLKWTSQKVGETKQNDIAVNKLSTTYITTACSSNPDCFNGNGTRQIQETGIFLPASFQNNYSVQVCLYISGVCESSVTFDGYFEIDEDKGNKSNQELTALIIGIVLGIFGIIVVVVVVVVVVLLVLLVRCWICYQCNCCRKVGEATRISILAKKHLHPVVLEWNRTCIKKDAHTFVIKVDDVRNENIATINMTQRQFDNLKCCVYGIEPETTYRFTIQVQRSNKTLIAQSMYTEVKNVDIIRLEGEAIDETKITLWWYSNIDLRHSTLHLTRKNIQSKKPLKNQDKYIYIDEVDYSKSLKFGGQNYTIESPDNCNGTYTVNKLKPQTRYVFFITMTKGTTVTQSNAIEIQTSGLTLAHLQNRVKEKTAIKVTSSGNSIDQKYIKLFVKVDHEIPKLKTYRTSLDQQWFEIDGQDPKQQTRIWITSGDIWSNIITLNENGTLAIKLRLEKRKESEARFVVLLPQELGSPACDLYYGDEFNMKDRKLVTDVKNCFVEGLEANVCYWYYLQTTVNDITYSSNIIRDVTLGKPFIRQQLQT